ncbi:hypothetical protein ACHAXN_007876 [Cyclotella atomus]
MSDDDSSLGDIETPPPKQKSTRKKSTSSRKSTSSENHVPERPQSGPPQSNPDELAEGLSRWIEASTSFFYVEIFSLVLVFSCWAHWVDWIYMKYALSVGAVSLGICVILQTMEFMFPGWLGKVIVKERSDGSGGHTVEKIASVFLLVWWSIGAGIITFHGPFVATSNGWFAAWGGYFATLHWCLGIDTSYYNDLSECRRYMKFLQFWSFILIFASIAPLRYKDLWPGYGGAGLAVATGAISLIALMYVSQLYDDLSRDIMRMTMMLGFILWAIMDILLVGSVVFVHSGYG